MAFRLGQGRASNVPDGVEHARVRAPLGGRAKLGILTAVAIGVLIGVAFGYERAASSHFYPGTRIGDVLVGSRTLNEASSLLHENFVTPLKEPVTVTAPQFERRVTPWKMGLRIDVSEAARDALSSQRSEALLVRVWHRVFGDSHSISLRPEVNDDAFARFLRKTYKRVNRDSKDARLEIKSDKLNVIPHKLGRKVLKKHAEKALLTGLVQHDETIEIPVKVIEPELTTADFKRVILINTSTNRLKLYKNGELAKKYGVATGAGGFPTPHGQWYITAKRMNPTWYNPYAEWSLDMPPYIGPGPDNPLGTRALNLNASGIRIHGTPDSWSIGSNASHGCIRMHMRDAEDLFDRVEVGTPVLIIG